MERWKGETKKVGVELTRGGANEGWKKTLKVRYFSDQH